MAQLFTNNAVSELFAPITAGATSMDIVPGDESLFPTIAGGSGDFFMLTLEVGSTREIVKVNSTSVNTFGIVRAQESTSATGFSASATVALRVTAGQMGQLFPVDVTANATGTLPATLGGTGQASYTIGDLILATAATVLSVLSVGATNTIIMSNGTTPIYTGAPIITTLQALTALKTGATPASAGAVRLSNTEKITARNAGDSADKTIAEVDASDQTFIGGASDQVSVRNETTISAENATGSALIDLFKLDVNDLWRLLVAPVMNNDLALSSRDNANTVTIPLIEVDSNDDIIFGNLLNQNTGFGRTAPEARHHFGGSVSFPIRTVTSNATYGDDFTIVADTDTGDANITLNLPTASNSTGRVYVAKKQSVGATHTVTIEPAGSETIEGVANIGLTANNETRVMQSDGTNWRLIVA